jgi:hypothetical protein
VLGGALPNPAEVARELGPLAAEGRLTGWARDPQEQALFEGVHLAGALPDLRPGTPPAEEATPADDLPADLPDPELDGYAVVINNAGANKLDVYLARDVAYDAVVDPATGAVDGTLTVTFTNSAPADLPDGVAGNYTGDDRGTNRVLLSVYSALTPGDATITTAAGSAPVVLTRDAEAGWQTGTTLVAVPPGEPVTVTVRLSGTVDTGAPYGLAVRPLPLVQPETHRIAVRTTTGRDLVRFAGPLTTPRTFGPATAAE